MYLQILSEFHLWFNEEKKKNFNQELRENNIKKNSEIFSILGDENYNKVIKIVEFAKKLIDLTNEMKEGLDSKKSQDIKLREVVKTL